MIDREKLTEVFKDVGIPFKTEENGDIKIEVEEESNSYSIVFDIDNNGKYKDIYLM